MNIRYGKAFKIPRKIIKYTASALYPIIIKVFPLPRVLSIEATLKKLIEDKASIVRFGDGEFIYLIDKINLPFQEYDEQLSKSMKGILKSNDPSILVGLPIGYHSLNNLNKKSRLTWRSQITWIYPRLRKHLDLDKTYYNASMTRLYIDFVDKSQCSKNFELVMRIWDGRNIVLIEGEKSRLGMGNDLFSNAASVQRILAPAHHAYRKYAELLNEASKQSKDKLILVALGPTAKPLVFNLAKKGYQAIDIGNIDIEYEWYIRGATNKIKIPGKYTSEASEGRTVEEEGDLNYRSQVIARFI